MTTLPLTSKGSSLLIMIDKEEPLEIKGKVVMVIRRMDMVPA